MRTGRHPGVPSKGVLAKFGCAAGVALCLVAALPGSARASRVLVDEVGRSVAVPDAPHRVVCLAPSVTDTVFALGAGGLVAAISDHTRYPAAALAKPSVGDALEPSVETIATLHPDLVIGVAGRGQQEAAERLTRLGIPVFLLDTHGLDGVLRAVTDTGHALNRDRAAALLTAQLQARIQAVRARTRGAAVPRVFLPVWYDPVITIGRHAFITEIIAAAGGRSVTDDLAADWPQVSLETVIARAPQLLLLVRGGGVTLSVLRQRPGWDRLQAVRKGQVVEVDERIELPSPAAVDALEELARQLHP